MPKRPNPKPETPKARKPRKKTTAVSKNFATRVGNGSALLLDAGGAIDGRSLPARRFAELTLSIASDLGGLDNLSTIEQQLTKRFAGAAVVAELTEAAIVAGGEAAEKVDLAQYVSLLNAQNRLAGTLGVKRVVLDLQPSLAEILAQKVAQRPQEGEESDEDDGGGK